MPLFKDLQFYFQALQEGMIDANHNYVLTNLVSSETPLHILDILVNKTHQWFTKMNYILHVYVYSNNSPVYIRLYSVRRRYCQKISVLVDSVICDRLWENPAKVARQNSEKKEKMGEKKKKIISKDGPLIHFIHPKVQKYVQKCLKIAPNVIAFQYNSFIETSKIYKDHFFPSVLKHLHFKMQ
jgi:hypothetical protein